LHRVSLGDFELTVLSDGPYWLDGGAMFGVVPKPLWSKKIQADEQNRITLGLNSLLIRTGDHNVLVETGIGPKLNDKAKAIYGHEPQLMKEFEQTKLDSDEIDIVINTHLHFDHCGWNTYPKDGKFLPTFPRAKYYVQRGEWEHAQEQHDRDRVSYNSPNYNPLIESGQMVLLSGEREIVPGVSVKLFPGHTRHMQAVYVTSGGKTAVYVSDLVPTTAHLDATWVMGYDLDPITCIDNRKRFYAEAVPNEYLVVFTHDLNRPMAYIDVPGDRGGASDGSPCGEVGQPPSRVGIRRQQVAGVSYFGHFAAAQGWPTMSSCP
jgi:glyoxylase-like metal-dependent hydrolase (beta-lactamase superfamily II)